MVAHINASDVDSGDYGRIVYVVTSTDTGVYFYLDSNSGAIKLTKSLDLEVLQAIGWNRTIVTVARDYGVPQLSSNTTTTILRVSSVNEFPPVFTTPSKTVKISEGTPVGTVLCHVTATDKDFGRDGIVW